MDSWSQKTLRDHCAWPPASFGSSFSCQATSSLQMPPFMGTSAVLWWTCTALSETFPLWPEVWLQPFCPIATPWDQTEQTKSFTPNITQLLMTVMSFPPSPTASLLDPFKYSLWGYLSNSLNILMRFSSCNTICTGPSKNTGLNYRIPYITVPGQRQNWLSYFLFYMLPSFNSTKTSLALVSNISPF